MEQNSTMTPEQLAALQQAAQGMAGSATPTPTSAQVQQESTTPVAPAQRQPSSQDILRNRMRQQAISGAQPTATVSVQGDTYNPTQSTAQAMPTQGATANPVVANRTIINTTQTDGVQPDDVSDDTKSKFKLTPLMAVIIVVVALVLIFLGWSYLSKAPNEENESATTESSEEWVDPFANPDIEWIDQGAQWEYPPEQVQRLRAAGFTGDEIEAFQESHADFDDLIKQAEAERDAFVQEAIAPLYDTASDEYKHFISQTWLALEEREDIYNWEQTCMYYQERKNLDYEKVDVYGNQLYIKVYLDDFAHEEWFYCLVTPDEWLRLNDAGNIIVNYTYVTQYVDTHDAFLAHEDTENIYITDASIEFLNN